MSTFIIVQVGDHEYGIDIRHVKSIEPMQHSTHMFGTHPSIRGVINLHNHVVPIVDLNIKFGYPFSSDTKDTRLIIVPGAEGEIGLVVKEANQVVEIADDSINSPKESWAQNPYINGTSKIDDKIVGIIDIDLVVRPEAYNN